MKISKQLLIVFLFALFLIPFIPMGTSIQKEVYTTSSANSSLGPEPVLPSPEPPHRLLPISILVYTELADLSSGGEYDHTISSIEGRYDKDFYTTNLTDYNDLGSVLPGHDILLILEQELGNRTLSATIGAAWSTILNNFVNDGGIVILMDCYSLAYSQDGPTIPILNASGLMDITAIGTAGSGFTVNVVNNTNALARQVNPSFPAADGTVRFNVSDATVVCDDGSSAVVAHKVMGKGHVVLLGFDLFSFAANPEDLITNAIKLHRHVIFDNSHGQYEDIFGEYEAFANQVVNDDFAVSTINYFDTDTITASEVLIIPYCTTYYSAAEKAFLENYVLQGGGLFLLADWGIYGEAVGDLAQIFGYGFDNSYTIISDTDDNEAPFNDPAQPFYSGMNIRNHSLTIDTSTIQMYYGTAILSLPGNAYSVINTDTDGTAQWVNGTTASGLSVYAASTFGMGRVVVSGDCNFLEFTSDYDGDGTPDYMEHQNDVLLPNTVRWLSAAGLVERKVLFDTSHGLWTSWSQHYPLLKYLTSNGYTVHWMTTWYPTMVDMAHVLVLIAGGTPYTPAQNVTIRNFVNDGGGLLILTDWTYFGDTLDPVVAEFGMIRNTTHAYLYDTDDGLGGASSAIFYNGANIETHPTTVGVNSIYIDRGTGIINLGGGTALVTTDNDGTSHWNNDSTGLWPADAIPVIGAKSYGLGRLIYLPDVNFVTQGIFEDEDNELFLVNAFEWLSENRAPIVELTYPNGGETVNNNITITWNAFEPNKDLILGFDLFYSNDSGSSWYPIILGTLGNSFEWNTTQVPNGDDYLIRIVAHDYELFGTDDSDAVFTIDNPIPLPPPIPPILWWIIAIVVIIIFVIVLIYLFILRPRSAASK